jgi:cyclase
VRNPELINAMAAAFGAQFVVVAVDTRSIEGQDLVHLSGGRIKTAINTLIGSVKRKSAGPEKFC